MGEIVFGQPVVGKEALLQRCDGLRELAEKLLPPLLAQRGLRSWDGLAIRDPHLRPAPREPVLFVIEPLAAKDDSRDGWRTGHGGQQRDSGSHGRAVHDRLVAIANSALGENRDDTSLAQ